jgi:hypothetical protein
MKCRFASFAAAAALALLAVGTAPAQSLIPNYDFEVDADANSEPDDWFHGGPTSYITTDDSDGVGSSSVGLTGRADWRSKVAAVAPLEQLTWSIDYKVAPGTTGGFRADLRYFRFIAANGGEGGGFQGEDVHPVTVDNVVPNVWHTLGPFTVNVVAGSLPPIQVPAYADVRVSTGDFGLGQIAGLLQIDNIRVNRVIPEPATLGLVAMAGLGAVVVAHRRRRTS